jgi:tRNA A37 N6-isopentenylltransferase MiaA
LRRDEFLKEAKEHMENVKNARDGVVIVGGGMSGFKSVNVPSLIFLV